MLGNFSRTMFTEPWQYSNTFSRHAELKRNRALAATALKEWNGFSPGVVRSKEYADGFLDGYVDFLTYGGKGQPPYVAPRKYWRMEYQTPSGTMAVQDWFSGFQDGSSFAHSQGLRRHFTVPSISGPAREATPMPPNWPPPQPGWPEGITHELPPVYDPDRSPPNEESPLLNPETLPVPRPATPSPSFPMPEPEGRALSFETPIPFSDVPLTQRLPSVN